MAGLRMRTLALALGLLMLPFPAQAATVVVDAGHGGTDPGAIGVNGLQEKTVNLDIAQKLSRFLADRGYRVVMTRTNDVYWSLQERVDYTDAQNADLFVSIHANSYSNKNTRGSMVLYYDDAYPQESYPASEAMRVLTPQSKELAQQVLDAFVAEIGLPNQGLVPSAVFVVRMGSIPSILVETAFLSNRADAALLADDSARTRMASAIADGIAAYLPPDTVFPDLLGHWSREAVLRLKAQGVIEGSGDHYEPRRSLTRAEWVTMLGRLFELKAAPASAQQTGAGCAPGADAAGAGSSGGGSTGSGSRSSGSAGGGATSNALAGGSPAGSSSTSRGAAVGVLNPPTSVAAAVYGDGCTAPGSAAAGAAAFRDMPRSHWAFAALDQAVKAALLGGYPDGTLRPDQPVSRAEAAALFARLAGLKTAANAKPPFEDVAAGSWAAPAIAAMKAAGWIDGVAAGEFRPEQSISRAEAAALLDRYTQSVAAKANSRP